MTGAFVSSEVEVTVSPGVAFKIFAEEWPWLPSYVAEDPEGHRWTFAQARPTQRP